MRGRLWCGLLCLLLSPSVTSGQSKPDLNAIKAAEDAATKVYMTCVDRAAKRLDDHRSDPATIAQGALSLCGKEFDATVEAFARNYDNYLAAREKVSAGLRQTSMDFAIKQVLIHRKVGAEPKALSEADEQRRQKIWDPAAEKYRDCNIAAAKGIATQPGDPMSLALAARGMCMQFEGPLRKALTDAYADISSFNPHVIERLSSHVIERVREKILERNAAEIVAVRAAKEVAPPPPKPPLTRDY